MRAYQIESFGLDGLKLVDLPAPTPGAGEVVVDVQALSLNFRDYLVATGKYNPKLPLPATPLSDGAGVVSAVGAGVTHVKAGERVMSHFVSGWLDGAFRQAYLNTTLGLPAAGMAAEQVVLPAEAVVPMPEGYDFAQAATLPIAALTAWSVLVTEAGLQAGQAVLTLGTGGVSIFAVQLAKAMGARVFITSGSDEKLARARELGADETINYHATPKWEKVVLERTDGAGVDVTVETVGAATLNQSLKATRAGGHVGVLGALHGLEGSLNVGLLMMKRLHIDGIMVDSRAAFEDLAQFVGEKKIAPVIDQRFTFDQLPEAFRCLEAAKHFGKIVVTV
jgi:NADPH:quinone reductase-like Zn-dependent oxidoreductase